MLQGGERDAAHKALVACIDAAELKGEYRRLLSDLDRRLLIEGRVTLSTGGNRLTLAAIFPLLIGRDPDCQLQVRGQTVSRRHTRILSCPGGGFTLEDAGSHNGTLLNGLPIGAPMQLPASGEIGLGGPACTVGFTLEGDPPSTLQLKVSSGLDNGKLLVAGAGPHDVSKHLEVGPPLTVWFDNGRPLARSKLGHLQLNGARVGGQIQLIRDDLLDVDGRRIEVMD